MQKLYHDGSDDVQEDLIAQKILRRVQIAKLTRQLKSKLFRAGLKVKESQGKLSSTTHNSITNQKIASSPVRSITGNGSLPSDPLTPLKRKSSHLSKEETFSSPVKRVRHSSNDNLPSSPFYVTTSSSPSREVDNTQKVPATPRQATSTKISKVSKHRKHKDDAPMTSSSLLSTPKASNRRTKETTTPTSKFVNENEEGADLLLYLSNSPARTNTSSKEGKDYSSYISIPTTPKTSSSVFQFSSTPTFGIDSTPPRGSILPLPVSTPSAAIQSIIGTPGLGLGRIHTPGTPGSRSLVGNKTPGFSMSDYVNIFTPSPRTTKGVEPTSRSVSKKESAIDEVRTPK